MMSSTPEKGNFDTQNSVTGAGATVHGQGVSLACG